MTQNNKGHTTRSTFRKNRIYGCEGWGIWLYDNPDKFYATDNYVIENIMNDCNKSFNHETKYGNAGYI